MGRANFIGLFVLAAGLCLFPFIVGAHSYWISVFVFAGIYSLITLGLSMLMGYAGQISLGQGAFFGLGAYTSGLLTTVLHWNPWPAFLAAVVLTSFIALLIGIPTLKLKGHYLAMATLAFGVIVEIAFVAEVDLTGGPSGFGSIPRLSLFGFVLKGDLAYYFFVWSVVIFVLVLSFNMIHSRVGRALRSIHGSELAANAMGVDTIAYKVKVFVLGAALASIAGSLYAHYVTFVSPTACELKLSILLVVMVSIGGMNSLWGTILGTILLTVLPEFLSKFKDFDILVYGLILMLIMITMPEGLAGGVAALPNLGRRLLRREARS